MLCAQDSPGQPCPSAGGDGAGAAKHDACGWPSAQVQITPAVVEFFRSVSPGSSTPLSLAEVVDLIVRDAGWGPLSAVIAPALLRSFGAISIRGEGRLDSELSEESLALALLGIPPASEDGIALWLLLN